MAWNNNLNVLFGTTDEGNGKKRSCLNDCKEWMLFLTFMNLVSVVI